MVYEATKIFLFGANNDGNPITYTCASGTAIAKGTLLQLSDPMTVSAHSGVAQPIAGIAAMDKANNDYSTTISVWTDGIFDMKASGATLIGQGVTAGATGNTISGAIATASGAYTFGYCLEALGANETGRVKLTL